MNNKNAQKNKECWQVPNAHNNEALMTNKSTQQGSVNEQQKHIAQQWSVNKQQEHNNKMLTKTRAHDNELPTNNKNTQQ
jgi:ABC-type sulfate/molybdate transport systems ATPase subunit